MLRVSGDALEVAMVLERASLGVLELEFPPPE